jgi:hypothetical protein
MRRAFASEILHGIYRYFSWSFISPSSMPKQSTYDYPWNSLTRGFEYEYVYVRVVKCPIGCELHRSTRIAIECEKNLQYLSNSPLFSSAKNYWWDEQASQPAMELQSIDHLPAYRHIHRRNKINNPKISKNSIHSLRSSSAFWDPWSMDNLWNFWPDCPRKTHFRIGCQPLLCNLSWQKHESYFWTRSSTSRPPV